MRLFAYDGPLVKAVQFIWQTFLLNILFLMTCLPVLTIGPAVTALYEVLLNRSIESSLVKRYFRAFREAFRTSFVPWLIYLSALLLMLLDAWFLFTQEISGAPVFLGLLILSAALWLFSAVWFFPQRARYRAKAGQAFRNSLLLGFGKLPLTVFLAALWIAPILGLFGTLTLILVTGVVYLHIGFALTARISAWFLGRAFRKIGGEEKAEEKEPEEKTEEETSFEMNHH